MNLAQFFFFDEFAHITDEEFLSFCNKHNIKEPSDRTKFIRELIKLGARTGKIQWEGKEIEPAILFVGFLDNSYEMNKKYYGRGIKFLTNEGKTYDRRIIF
jgi:hypothetical protein